MSHPADHAPEQAFPHLHVVEDMLGMPIFPQGFDIHKALTSHPDGRCDVRVKAYELALSAILDAIGNRLNDKIPLTEEDRQHIAATDDMRFLQGILAVGNNVYKSETTTAALPEGADQSVTPRARFQSRLTRKMFDHIQTLPSSLTFKRDAPLRTQLNDNMVVIAPTGSGKTVLEATLMREAGIGKEISPTNKRVLKGVLATSEVRLVDQFSGVRGDDTFRRFLGPITVTRNHCRSKDTSGSVVATTGLSLVKMDLHDYAVAVIDEGHLALGPKALEFIGKIGIRCFLFTATPAYDTRKDLRRYFRHIEEGTLRGFVEQGILNPVRLLTFQYEENPELLAANLAHNYIKAGRKVVVYCRSGTKEQPAGPARRVAQLVNAMQGKEVARDVGKHNKHSDRDALHFDEGSIRMLATSKMLRAGWNADVDVAICVGPHFSLLDLQQKCGRPMRPGKYISELIELIPKSYTYRQRMVSLWQVFGIERIISGMVIGPVRQREQRGGAAEPDSDDGPYDNDQVVDLSVLSQDLLDIMVIDKPVRSILIGEKGKPPEGYVRAADWADQHDVPLSLLQSTLDRQGFSYQSIWDPHKDSVTFDRWYEPGMLDYLKANPIPKKAEGMHLIAIEAAELCGVTKNAFLRIAKSLGIVPHNLLGKSNCPSKRYDFTQIVMINDALNAIPVAGEDDIAVVDLETELRDYCYNNSLGILMQRQNAQGPREWCAHLTRDEVRKLPAYLHTVAADENHMDLLDIAEEAGIHLETLKIKMTGEENAACLFMRRRPGTKPVKHLPLPLAQTLIERVKSDRLPPHLITFKVILERVPVTRSPVCKWLKTNHHVSHLKRLPNSRTAQQCFSWQSLRALEEKYGLSPNTTILIDYSKVVQHEQDVDPERLEYSQRIQSLYLDREVLALPPEAKKHIEHASQPEPAAKPAGVAPDKRRELAQAAKPSKRPLAPSRLQPWQPRPAVKTQTPKSKSRPFVVPKQTAPTIPDHYIDLGAYLLGQGTLCEPSIVQALIRRHRLPKPIKDHNGALWSSEETALTLEEAIKEFPAAKKGMASPKQIAAHAGKGLTDKHIVHLASKLAISLDGRVQICRSQQADGRPGELSAHYDALLVEKIQTRLEKIMRDSLKFRSLLKFGPIG